MGGQQRTFTGAQVKIGAAFGAVLLIVALCMNTFLSGAAHALTTTLVDSLTDDSWSTADTRTNGHVALVEDSTAPLGEGALSLKTDTAPAPSQDKAQFMTAANNVLLSTVANNPMYYSTKQNSASFVAGLPSYQVAVNLLGTTGFTTLVYEPYNNEGNDAVHNGEWQQWNVGAGKFWSTRAVGSLQPSQGQYQYTLAQILAEFPDAQVLSVGVNVGSNNPGYDTEVDGFAFNGTVVDFDPAPVAPAVPTGLGFTQATVTCGGATNISPVNFKWNSVPKTANYTYHIDRPGFGAIEATTTSTSAPNFSFFFEGQYSFKVRANGQNGLQSDWSTPCLVKYDRTAPTVTISSPAFMTTIGTTLTFAGTTSVDATSVTVQFNGTNIGQATIAPNGNWSLTVPTPAFVKPYTAYTVNVTAHDAAGNTGTGFSYIYLTQPFSWWQ